MRETFVYIVILIVVAIFVLIFNKKSQSNYRKRKGKRFRDGYLEKRKEKLKEDNNENLH